MPHFFISYAKKDTRQLALELEAALNALPDVTAWVDRSLKAGRSWELQIQAQIDRCDYMIVLYSPDINRHKRGEDESYILSEIHYAKRVARKSIIPVMAQTTEPPMSLVMEQYIDFTLPNLQLADLIGAICDETGITLTLTLPVATPPRIEFPPAAPLKPAEPAAGTRMTDDKGVEMVYVPAGKFLMGSDDISSDEKPVHEVQITQPFWLDLTPVTNASYDQFVNEGGYENRNWWTVVGWKWVQSYKITAPINYRGFTSPQQPRVGVNWYEAVAYSAWRGGRLPTEAEWEWAACGPENRAYPWGDTFDGSRVIYNANSDRTTSIVGVDIRLSGASWVGTLDMCGNVWEWCSSLYAPYPYDAHDSRENYENSGYHIFRGGSWTYSGNDLSLSRRESLNSSYEVNAGGFRCARTYQPGDV